MKRALLVAMAALMVPMVVTAAPVQAKDVPAQEQIRHAYESVLDRSMPLSKRLPLLEDGQNLRSTIRELDSLEKISGFRVKTTGVRVHSMRIHEGDAEVVLSLLINDQMVTGWTGVARKIGGQWRVASATLCTILFMWTEVRCPQGPKGRLRYNDNPVDAASIDGEYHLDLTFADGASATLVVPPELAQGWSVHPRAELLLNGDTPISVWFEHGWVPATEPVRKYSAEPGNAAVWLDSSRGLVVNLGGWTAHARGLGSFNDDGALSERERELVARHLSGYTTSNGFPVLTPTAPLAFSHPTPEQTGVQLAKSALSIDASRNPIELSWSDRDSIYVAVVLTHGPCWTQPPQKSSSYWAVEQCIDDFGRIAVEGNPLIVEWLLESLRVERFEPVPITTAA